MPSNQNSLAEATHQECLQLDQEESISFFVSWYVLAVVEKRVAGADLPAVLVWACPSRFHLSSDISSSSSNSFIQ